MKNTVIAFFTYFLLLSTANAREKLVTAISPTVSLGIGGLRGGAALEIAQLRCVDACGGFGLSIGSSDFYRREYTIGGGSIGMYMGSILWQGDLRIRDGKISGFHLMPGFGLGAAFAILRIGYDRLLERPVLEIGITSKIPLTGW
jgi:hypothetical protein